MSTYSYHSLSQPIVVTAPLSVSISSRSRAASTGTSSSSSSCTSPTNANAAATSTILPITQPTLSTGLSSSSTTSTSSTPSTSSSSSPAVWLCRHGERLDATDPSWAEQAARPFDCPLTYNGVKQALATAHWLSQHASIRIIVASPFYRTAETAYHIATTLGLPLYIEPGLAEYLRGEQLISQIIDPALFGEETGVTQPPQEFSHAVDRLLTASELATKFPNIDLTYTPIIPDCSQLETETWTDVLIRTQHVIRVLVKRYVEGNMMKRVSVTDKIQNMNIDDKNVYNKSSLPSSSSSSSSQSPSEILIVTHCNAMRGLVAGLCDTASSDDKRFNMCRYASLAKIVGERKRDPIPTPIVPTLSLPLQSPSTPTSSSQLLLLSTSSQHRSLGREQAQALSELLTQRRHSTTVPNTPRMTPVNMSPVTMGSPLRTPLHINTEIGKSSPAQSSIKSPPSSSPLRQSSIKSPPSPIRQLSSPSHRLTHVSPLSSDLLQHDWHVESFNMCTHLDGL